MNNTNTTNNKKSTVAVVLMILLDIYLIFLIVITIVMFTVFASPKKKIENNTISADEKIVLTDNNFYYRYVNDPTGESLILFRIKPAAENGVIIPKSYNGYDIKYLALDEETSYKIFVEHPIIIDDFILNYKISSDKTYNFNKIIDLKGNLIGSINYYRESKNKNFIKELLQHFYSLPENVDLSTINQDFNLTKLDFRYLYANTIYNLNYSDEIYFIDDYDNSIIKYQPQNPVREGYRFTGWYKDKECSELWDFDNDVISKAIETNSNNETIYHYKPTILYAGWEEMI